MKARFFAVLLSASCAAASCSSDPEPAEPPQDALAAVRLGWEKQMEEIGKLRLQRVALLPGMLDRFASANRSDWVEAAGVIRSLEQREPGFVYDRVLELLDVAIGQDAGAAVARAELARMGQIVRLSARLDSDEPSDWRAARVALEALGAEGVDAAAVRLILKLGTRKPAVMAAALDEIVALGPGAVRHLCVAVSSPRVGQLAKEKCADALVRVGRPAVAAVSALLFEKSAPARYNAARILGKMSDPSAVDALLKAEESEKDPFVRCALLDALAETGGPGAEASVVRAISDPDLSVVKFGAMAAGRLRSKLAIPPLIDALERTADQSLEDVRTEVVGALRAITGHKGGADADWWRARTSAGGGGGK